MNGRDPKPSSPSIFLAASPRPIDGPTPHESMNRQNTETVIDPLATGEELPWG
jgi:hypothetical protein